MWYHICRTARAAECVKAAKILREFTMPTSRSGPDKLLPPGVLATCKGVGALLDLYCTRERERGRERGSGVAGAAGGQTLTGQRWSAAILSVLKVGFLMSIKGGSGLVTVRLSPTGRPQVSSVPVVALMLTIRFFYRVVCPFRDCVGRSERRFRTWRAGSRGCRPAALPRAEH